MLKPSCTIGNDIEVTFVPAKTGPVRVHIEEPDEKVCFKILDCTIPGYQLSNVYGFTRDVCSFYVQFCKNNAHLIVEAARAGGVELA